MRLTWKPYYTQVKPHEKGSYDIFYYSTKNYNYFFYLSCVTMLGGHFSFIQYIWGFQKELKYTRRVYRFSSWGFFYCTPRQGGPGQTSATPLSAYGLRNGIVVYHCIGKCQRLGYWLRLLTLQTGWKKAAINRFQKSESLLSMLGTNCNISQEDIFFSHTGWYVEKSWASKPRGVFEWKRF